MDGQIELGYLQELPVPGGTVLLAAGSMLHEAISDKEQELPFSNLPEGWWTAGPSIADSIMAFWEGSELRRQQQDLQRQQQDLQRQQQLEQQRQQQELLQQQRLEQWTYVTVLFMLDCTCT